MERGTGYEQNAQIIDVFVRGEHNILILDNVIVLS